MRKILLLLLLLVAPVLAQAQGVLVTAGPFNRPGLLYVCPAPSGGTPCPTPSQIFLDAALTQPLSNPISTPAETKITFYIAPGQYTLEMPASGRQEVITVTSGSGTPGGSPPQAQVNDPGNPGHFGGTACETFPSLTVGPVKVNCNWSPVGPSPYVDITNFGARPVNPLIAPAAAGITANCTATQTTCTISSASTFINGDGVIIYGAGATQSMTTPGAPTVTPSVAFAGTGTLVNTPGPTGATTYNYRIIARDRNGGLTTASSSGTTTTGAASLGSQAVNITSMARAGQVVTVTLAAAHGFLVGCNLGTCGEVYISGANALSDNTFQGWYLVASATDTTHITFQAAISTALGASTSSTGGQATFFNCNLVSWTAVTGAVDYGIYSDRAVGGTFALVGVSNPNDANGVVDTSFEDYGSPMMDNQAFPAIFPASFASGSPPAATSDSLSTTISSGAGTTTLTLANAVGTTVNGATIRLDSVPAILAAAATINSKYGTLFIPPMSSNAFSFVINSWLLLNGTAYAISQGGPLFLNDTIEVNSSANGSQWIGQPFPQYAGNVQVGAFSSGPTVQINTAHPGFFFSGSPSGLHVSHISPVSIPVNGTKAIFANVGFNQTFDWIDCGSGNGANDYMSSCYELRPNQPGNNFANNTTFDYVGLTPGGGSTGSSHTPTIYIRGAGNVAIPHSYSVHRGMQIAGGTNIQIGVAGMAYINGGNTPLLTSSPPTSGTNTTGTVTFGAMTLDTIADPCLAGLNNSGVNVQFLNAICVPSSGTMPLTGVITAIATGINPTLTTLAPNSGYTLTSSRQTNFPTNNATFPAIAGTVPTSGYQNEIYDNFNRANGGLGANWTTVTGFTAPSITTNQVVGPASLSGAYWSANVFDSSQFVQATFTGSGSPNTELGVQMNLNNAYVCALRGAASGLYTVTGGAFTAITTGTTNFSVGDVIRLEFVNGTLNCYQNGALIYTASSITARTGTPGFVTNSNTASFDNFSGGNLHPIGQLDVEQDWMQPQHFTQPITIGSTIPIAGALSAGLSASQINLYSGANVATMTWLAQNATGNPLLSTSNTASIKFLDCSTTSTCAQSSVSSPVFLIKGGPIALSGGTIAIGSLPFASSASYVCNVNDVTATNAVQVVYTSGTTVTFNGTTTDSIRYICWGI